MGDLPCSGHLKACKDAQFPTVESDHGTALALLALLGCQSSCSIVPNGPASSYLGSFNTYQCLNC